MWFKLENGGFYGTPCTQPKTIFGNFYTFLDYTSRNLKYMVNGRDFYGSNSKYIQKCAKLENAVSCKIADFSPPN